MESESPSRETAAKQLAAHDRASSRARTIPREHVLMLVWSAALITVYIATCLMATSSLAPGDGISTPYVLLFPLLTFSGVMNGATQRFGIHARIPRVALVFAIVLLAAFMILTALTLLGTAYPWWINLALPAVLFVGLLVSGRRLLEQSTVDEHSTWEVRPLTAPVRLTTSIVGVALGALVAASATDLATAITAMATMVVLVAMLCAWTTRYGLARAGLEWARIHWIAFGVSVAIAFLAAMLKAWTTALTLPLAIALGAVAAGIVAGSAFVSTRAHR